MSSAPTVRAQNSPSGVAAIDPSTLNEIARIIDHAWTAGPGGLQPRIVYDAVEWVTDALDAGRIRVAERQGVHDRQPARLTQGRVDPRPGHQFGRQFNIH